MWSKSISVNNKKYSTTRIVPYLATRNINDEQLNSNIIFKTEKSRKKIKKLDENSKWN